MRRDVTMSAAAVKAEMPESRGRRVMMCMGSRILGGPGKGLAQYLRCGGADSCRALVVGFDTTGEADSEFLTRMRQTGVEVRALRQRRALDLSLVGQLRSLAEGGNFEIFQSHGYKSHLLCLLMRLFHGGRWVAFTHGWTCENIKMRFYRLLELALIRFADQVVAVSENTAQRLGPLLGHKTVVIPNAVDPDEYDFSADGGALRHKYGVNESGALFCTVGRMSPEKGHMVLLEAIRRNRADLGGVIFILAGDGPCRRELEEFVALHGLEPFVTFAGYVSDMSPFYAAMDALVLPSFSEGMPNVVLEAMLFGKPVLATRVGGVAEVVVEGVTGDLVPSGSPEALGEGVLRFVRDRERMETMGKAGFDEVRRRFDPHVRATAITDLYETLCSQGSALAAQHGK
ncbi:glycosyltransferase family 4 protein [Salidesulfovibrio brasiliensis]|uniref:glycosyltransferase family 4 protein n=1 Tax=Salidesulfovibrio brasiliensis TaxID=221711 RepID=UPI0006CF662C|nr:glycosyltransferase family 4 protein [Salidesulfovibrio brasiliensis]